MKALSLMMSICLLAGCNDPSSTATPTGSTSPPSSSLQPMATEGAWRHSNRLAFDGRTRTYSVYTPTGRHPLGLMVVLHGSGETVESIISEVDMESAARENRLMVVVPAGVDNGWNDEEPPGGELPDDVGFIDALVTEMKRAYPTLPPSKVFTLGFSNGGGLATRLACQSTQIRGVGVVGNYYEGVFDACRNERHFSIPGWFGAGVEDDVVPVESVRAAMSSYVADLTNCSGMGPLQAIQVPDLTGGVVCKQITDCDGARLCEYAGRGHEFLPNAFEATWHFLSEAVESSAN